MVARDDTQTTTSLANEAKENQLRAAEVTRSVCSAIRVLLTSMPEGNDEDQAVDLERVHGAILCLDIELKDLVTYDPDFRVNSAATLISSAERALWNVIMEGRAPPETEDLRRTLELAMRALMKVDGERTALETRQSKEFSTALRTLS